MIRCVGLTSLAGKRCPDCNKPFVTTFPGGFVLLRRASQPSGGVCEDCLERRGRCYYVVRQHDGLIKIGTTLDLVTRFRALRRDYPRCRLAATEIGYVRRELELHKEFAASRVVGEWFRPDETVLEHLSDLRYGEGPFIDDLKSVEKVT